MAARGSKGVGGAILRIVVKATTVGAGPASRFGRRGRLGLGGERRLSETFEPKLVPHIPAQCAVGCNASAEALIIAEPEARRETGAGTTYDGLVGQEARGALGEAGDEDLYVQVPGFHPRSEIGDGTLRGRFRLRDDEAREDRSRGEG